MGFFLSFFFKDIAVTSPVANLRCQAQRPCMSPRGYVACEAWR